MKRLKDAPKTAGLILLLPQNSMLRLNNRIIPAVALRNRQASSFYRIRDIQATARNRFCSRLFTNIQQVT
jgi:hypothetical protein